MQRKTLEDDHRQNFPGLAPTLKSLKVGIFSRNQTLNNLRSLKCFRRVYALTVARNRNVGGHCRVSQRSQSSLPSIFRAQFKSQPLVRARKPCSTTVRAQSSEEIRQEIKQTIAEVEQLVSRAKLRPSDKDKILDDLEDIESQGKLSLGENSDSDPEEGDVSESVTGPPSYDDPYWDTVYRQVDLRILATQNEEKRGGFGLADFALPGHLPNRIGASMESASAQSFWYKDKFGKPMPYLEKGDVLVFLSLMVVAAMRDRRFATLVTDCMSEGWEVLKLDPYLLNAAYKKAVSLHALPEFKITDTINVAGGKKGKPAGQGAPKGFAKSKTKAGQKQPEEQKTYFSLDSAWKDLQALAEISGEQVRSEFLTRLKNEMADDGIDWDSMDVAADSSVDFSGLLVNDRISWSLVAKLSGQLPYQIRWYCKAAMLLKEADPIVFDKCDFWYGIVSLSLDMHQDLIDPETAISTVESKINRSKGNPAWVAFIGLQPRNANCWASRALASSESSMGWFQSDKVRSAMDRRANEAVLLRCLAITEKNPLLKNVVDLTQLAKEPDALGFIEKSCKEHYANWLSERANAEREGTQQPQNGKVLLDADDSHPDSLMEPSTADAPDPASPQTRTSSEPHKDSMQRAIDLEVSAAQDLADSGSFRLRSFALPGYLPGDDRWESTRSQWMREEFDRPYQTMTGKDWLMVKSMMVLAAMLDKRFALLAVDCLTAGEEWRDPYIAAGAIEEAARQHALPTDRYVGRSAKENKRKSRTISVVDGSASSQQPPSPGTEQRPRITPGAYVDEPTLRKLMQSVMRISEAAMLSELGKDTFAIEFLMAATGIPSFEDALGPVQGKSDYLNPRNPRLLGQKLYHQPAFIFRWFVRARQILKEADPLVCKKTSWLEPVSLTLPSFKTFLTGIQSPSGHESYFQELWKCIRKSFGKSELNVACFDLSELDISRAQVEAAFDRHANAAILQGILEKMEVDPDMKAEVDLKELARRPDAEAYVEECIQIATQRAVQEDLQVSPSKEEAIEVVSDYQNVEMDSEAVKLEDSDPTLRPQDGEIDSGEKPSETAIRREQQVQDEGSPPDPKPQNFAVEVPPAVNFGNQESPGRQAPWVILNTGKGASVSRSRTQEQLLEGYTAAALGLREAVSWKSAGLLPYSFHEETGELQMLVASFKTGSRRNTRAELAPFGGERRAVDVSAEATAVRSLTEVTAVLSRNAVQPKHIRHVVWMPEDKYALFFMRASEQFISAPLQYGLRRDVYGPHGRTAPLRLCWIPLSMLIDQSWQVPSASFFHHTLDNPDVVLLLRTLQKEYLEQKQASEVGKLTGEQEASTDLEDQIAGNFTLDEAVKQDAKLQKRRLPSFVRPQKIYQFRKQRQKGVLGKTPPAVSPPPALDLALEDEEAQTSTIKADLESSLVDVPEASKLRPTLQKTGRDSWETFCKSISVPCPENETETLRIFSIAEDGQWLEEAVDGNSFSEVSFERTSWRFNPVSSQWALQPHFPAKPRPARKSGKATSRNAANLLASLPAASSSYLPVSKQS